MESKEVEASLKNLDIGEKSPIDKVFECEELVELIVKTVIDDVLEDLELRTVSKTFNKAVLRRVRLRHQKLDISVDECGKDSGKQFSFDGERFLTEQQFEAYCKFLAEVAEVRVEELRVKPGVITTDQNGWGAFHGQVHKLLALNKKKVTVVTGLTEFCPQKECAACNAYAAQCREFGPLTISTLKHLEDVLVKPKRYETLWISDELLRSIAGEFATKQSQAMYPLLLPAVLNELIRCNFLRIRWSEDLNTVTVIPPQILEKMVLMWKPKVVEVEMHSNRYTWKTGNEWMTSKFFRTFMLGGTWHTYQKANFLLKRVHINLLGMSFHTDNERKKLYKLRSVVPAFLLALPAKRISMTFGNTNIAQADTATYINQIIEHAKGSMLLVPGVTVDVAFYPTCHSTTLEQEAMTDDLYAFEIPFKWIISPKWGTSECKFPGKPDVVEWPNKGFEIEDYAGFSLEVPPCPKAGQSINVNVIFAKEDLQMVRRPVSLEELFAYDHPDNITIQLSQRL